MPDIHSLGYARVRVTDMARWRSFAAEEIGFAFGSGPEKDALYLRIDERPGRIVLLPGDEDRLEAVGWEVPDAVALEKVWSAVEKYGLEVRRMTQQELDLRMVAGGILFVAPGGTPVEIFHHAALDHSPVAAPFGNRFVTGALGFGHIVVPVLDVDRAFEFYRDVLAFHDRGSFLLPAGAAYPGAPSLRMRFMGPNARHHSLAIFPTADQKAPALMHIMVEVETLDEVGRALDRVLENGSHLSVTLGKHTNDKMVSFYVQTPGGWDLEVGYNGVLVDQSTYTAEEITADSYWGHAWNEPPQD